MSKHLSVFDRWISEEWDRIDAMGVDEKRAVLRRFGLTAVLWRKDHTPRYALDINFDLDDQWWVTDDQWDDDDLHVIFTYEDGVLCSNSSGCIVRKNTPVVRLRWTDRDLVALAAD